jgi:hypothetical protein
MKKLQLTELIKEEIKNILSEESLKYKLLHDPESITEEDLIVKRDLDLQGTKITQLPDNLQVEDSLDLSYTKITQLPDNLKVNLNLYVENTKITQLPNNLQVRGYLWLQNTPLAEKYSKNQIRQMIKDKGGYVREGIKI